MKIIGILTTSIIVMFYSAVMNGWALTKLWAWFVVPSLSAPVLNIPQAIGVAMVVGYLTTKDSDLNKKNDDWSDTLIKAVSIATVKPLVALGFGWIVCAFL